MRIAILAHLHYRIAEPFLGGTEMHTSMVANELVRRGHEVTLFAKQGSLSEARVVPVLAANFTYGATPGRDGRDASNDVVCGAALAAIEQIRAGGFDVVFNNSLGHLPYTELHDQAMLTVLHTPATLDRVTAVVEQPGWQPGPLHVYASVSDFNALGWRELLPAVETVWNGIYRSEWAQQGSPEDDLAVWAARITPEKGLHLGIEAAKRAGMRLNICGPVADVEYFQTVVRPRLDARCVYRGHLDHEALATELGRSAVFVSSPQWAEPFGLSMVEAMASGTPVAALPLGAAHEVVGVDGGVVARDGSVEALTEAVVQASGHDRSRVQAWGRRFDVETMIDSYEKLLFGLLR